MKKVPDASRIRIWNLVVIVLVLAFNITGCGHKKKVIVFVIDSISSLTPEDRKTFSFFREITHGEIVGSIILNSSEPDGLSLLSVDSIMDSGIIDRERYLATLQKIYIYTMKHPNDKVLLNISFGSYGRDQEEELLIKKLTDKGVLIVAAAGNENWGRAIYPAGYEKVIAVAASKGKQKASYSNYGKYIDICADGEYQSFEQAMLPDAGGFEIQTRRLKISGTSFAAPMVTGTIGRMLHFNPDLSRREIVAILKQTAKPIDSNLYRKGKLGAGLLSRGKALKKTEPYYLLYSFFEWLWKWVSRLIFIIINSCLIAFAYVYLCVGEPHSRLKKAGKIGAAIGGITIGLAGLLGIILNVVDIPSFLSGFLGKYAYNFVPPILLGGGVLGIAVSIGKRIGKLIGHIFTLHKISHYAETKDIRGLEHEMRQCSGTSKIQKRILSGIFGCGEKATSFLGEVIAEGSFGLDKEMEEMLKEFYAKYPLARRLMKIASDDDNRYSARENAVKMLVKLAGKDDREVSDFIRRFTITSMY